MKTFKTKLDKLKTKLKALFRNPAIAVATFLLCSAAIAGGGYFCFTLARANDDGITQETPPTEYWIDQITPETEFSGGTGTQTDPYKISSALELALLAKRTNDPTTNSQYATKYYIQTQTIDLANYEWTPIGKYDSNHTMCFSGCYDGGNFEIQNLYINSTENHQGLFGAVYNSLSYDIYLSKIKLINCDISGKGYIGGLSGKIEVRSSNAANINVSHCYVSGNIKATDWRVGGIFGDIGNHLSVDNCKNYANIYSQDGYVGGVYGNYNTGSGSIISNCVNEGTIECKNGYIGGIAGCGSVYIQNCINRGDILGGYYVGGIAGDGFNVDNCVNFGKITASQYGVGGIVGYFYVGNSRWIKNSVNYGDVLGMYQIGGVLGYAYTYTNYEMSIIACTNYGRITGTTSSTNLTNTNFTGGIVGGHSSSYTDREQSTMTIALCCNFGEVISSATAGGICGGSTKSGFPLNIVSCFSYGDVTGNAVAGAIIGYTGDSEGSNGTEMRTISDCVVDCTVKGKRAETYAGVIGATRDNVTISACEIKMTIENATTVNEVNGIYGYKYADPTINACFVDLNGTKLYTIYDGENGWADYWTLIDGFNNNNLMAKGMFHIAQFGTATNEEILRKLEEMGYAPFSPQTE